MYVSTHGAVWGVLTDDAEDTQDVGRKYHQHVDDAEQDESDGDVAQPVEGFGGKQHLLEGSPHLQAHTGPNQGTLSESFLSRRRPETNLAQTHREEHDGDGQRHGGEDGHSHAQDQGVIRVDPAVGVQQLRLHFVWINIERDSFGVPC